MRVLLVISSLERGGAERQVVALANHLDPSRFEVIVCTLSQKTPLAAELDARISVVVAEKRWRFDPGTVRRFISIVRQFTPDVIHAFLFDAEMVARIAGRLTGTPLVVASERNSNYLRPRLQAVCHRLTRNWYDILIANSEAGRQFAVRNLGLAEERTRSVPNGVDTARFRPMSKNSARDALKLPADRPLVGMVASLKPQKNHSMFAKFAAYLRERSAGVEFLCVGASLGGESGLNRMWRSGAGLHGDTSAYARGVRELVERSGLSGAVHWRPSVDDMSHVYNACDVVVLTSDREGTPNCVLEAMACGRPVVATDVGDSGRIIVAGTTGYVVARNAAEEMACRVASLLRNPALSARMGESGRARCEREYSLSTLARRVAAVYEEELSKTTARRRRRLAENGRHVAGAATFAAAEVSP